MTLLDFIFRGESQAINWEALGQQSLKKGHISRPQSFEATAAALVLKVSAKQKRERR
jgi:hypothetical protein